MKAMILPALLVMLTVSPVHAGSNTLLQQYAEQGAAIPSAQRGRDMWQQTFAAGGEFSERSCASCHTRNLSAPGKHVKTGKAIRPMSPSVNPERLSDARKVEKWFLRNCKWTLGRECSPQEKADFLAYIETAETI
jgi:mono/diheme cytochrome c family protein